MTALWMDNQHHQQHRGTILVISISLMLGMTHELHFSVKIQVLTLRFWEIKIIRIDLIAQKKLKI